MALTDEQLEVLSDALVPLFQYLEKEVIADIARRIQKTLTYTRTAELQAISMRELGYSPSRIRMEAMKLLNADPEYRKAVAKNTLEYKREVRDTINNITKQAYQEGNEIVANAGNMAWISDLLVWKSVEKELTDNSFLPQLVEAFRAQTAGELVNLTRTTGFKAKSGYESMEDAYRRELDKAVIKICSGTFSRDRVLKDVVTELSQSGLRSIDYASGRSMQLDTAANLALRTAINQLAARVTDRIIAQTGVNLVYVTKHPGARNTGTGHANHEQWQGKVYYIAAGKDYTAEASRLGQAAIESLWEITGYSSDGSQKNDPVGLHGYNCRHHHRPWFEGVLPLPKENPEPEPVTINGKVYDYYAVTQRMRLLERGIRALKREKGALKSLGMDTTEIKAKIERKSREYREFCAQCNVSPKNNRLRYHAGSSDLTKTKAYEDYQKIIEESKEQFRKKDNIPHRKMVGDIEIIDQPTYNKLIKPVIKSGGLVLRGPDVTDHLDANQASASSLPGIILFSDKVTVSDVLEETYHFKQNLRKLNDKYSSEIRTILNEIDAKKYLLKMTDKYKIPANQVELTKAQLESYKKELEERKQKGEY